MVRVFISDIIKTESRVGLSDTAKLIYEGLPLSLCEYLDSTKNEKLRLSRISAYGLLKYALERFYEAFDLEIKRGLHGKPSLCNSSLKINLSHTESFCAVAISDDCEVGVDIEERIEDSRAKRLETRFFTDLDFDNSGEIEDIKYYGFEYDKNGNLEESPTLVNGCDGGNDLGFTRLWTLSEATMKCIGKGFSMINSLKEELPYIEAKTITVKKNGKECILSVVIKKVR